MIHRLTQLVIVGALASVALAGETKLGASLSAVVTAKSALVMDAASGKVLWSRNPGAKRYPASTTKILTALLLLERCKAEDVIVAPEGVEEIEGSSLHLRVGERLSVLDMAYGLILRSANDGSYATALHVSGSVEAFAAIMNERAKEIGCTDSHFSNPHGLPAEDHWTTAHDLALIAREAMKHDLFRKVAGTRKRQVARDLNLEDTWLISKNNTLSKDEFAEGIKTGYTVAAGHCFVGSANQDGFRVVTVILASENWRADQKAMSDWAFKNYELATVRKAGDRVGEVAIPGGDPHSVRAALNADVQMPVEKGAEPTVSIKIKPFDSFNFPVKKGSEVGLAVLSDDAGWRVEVPVRAEVEVQQASVFLGGKKAPWSFYLMACMLGAGAYIVRKRALRMVTNARSR